MNILIVPLCILVLIILLIVYHRRNLHKLGGNIYFILDNGDEIIENVWDGNIKIHVMTIYFQIIYPHVKFIKYLPETKRGYDYIKIVLTQNKLAQIRPIMLNEIVDLRVPVDNRSDIAFTQKLNDKTYTYVLSKEKILYD